MSGDNKRRADSPADRARLYDIVLIALACTSFSVLVVSFFVRLIYRWRNRRLQKQEYTHIQHHDELSSGPGYSEATFKAENAFITERILQEGIVWPEASQLLGLDNNDGPSDGTSSSTGDTPSRQQVTFAATVHNKLSSRLFRRNGAKKDICQSILAISLLAVLCLRSQESRSTHRQHLDLLFWIYSTVIFVNRHYLALTNRTIFRSKAYDHLTVHIILLTFGISFTLVSDLYTTLIGRPEAVRAPSFSEALPSILAVSIFLLEIVVPHNSNYVRVARHNDNTRQGQSTPRSEETQELLSDNLRTLQLVTEYVKEEDLRPPAPEITASILSRATCSFIDSFILKHTRIPVSSDSIPDIRPDDKASFAVLQYREARRKLYSQRSTNDSASPSEADRKPIFKQMFRQFWPTIVQLAGYAMIKPWLTVLQPYFINLLLKWATLRDQGEQAHASDAAVYGLGLFAAIVAKTLSQSEALLVSRSLGTRMKAIIASEVYSKLLRRKGIVTADADSAKGEGGVSRSSASAGKAQNIVSVDVDREAALLADNPLFLPDAILSLIIVLVMLYNVIGVTALATIAAMIGQNLYQVAVARISYRYQQEVQLAADDRLSLTSEIMHSIKTLKFLAWEDGFAERLQEKRTVELRKFRKQTAIRALISGVTYSGPIMIALITFLFHTKILNRRLDATTAFTALSLINIVREPFEAIVGMLQYAVAGLVSCRRIDQFLGEEDIVKADTDSSRQDSNKIGFENATFTWSGAPFGRVSEESGFELRNLDINFRTQGINLVIGSVASGKSSLLQALLGEMTLTQGRYFLPSLSSRRPGRDPAAGLLNSVAFCAQTPWLQNGTIRDNILFGAAFNADRYGHVLNACALLPDLAALQRGDKTQVGEKGTVLSGGQKARISLARAVYSPARVLLLDDILSAVDSHTARHVALRCLSSIALMEGRTCILVTHATRLMLPLAAHVVEMAAGSVAFAGSSKDYLQHSAASHAEFEVPDPTVAQCLSNPAAGSRDRTDPGTPSEQISGMDAAATQPDGQMSDSGSIQTGSVKFDVYQLYFRYFASTWVMGVLVAVITLTEITSIYTNWFLRLWAGSFDDVAGQRTGGFYRTDDWTSPGDRQRYLTSYVTLALLSVLLYTARLLFWFWRGTHASARIYEVAIKGLLMAPLRHFDITPVGQIMNRLSTDIGTLDQSVSAGLLYSTLELFATVGVVIAIAIALPRFLIVGIFILLAYIPLGWAFVASGRDLTRVESVSRTPYYSLIGETTIGVATIRAYSDSARFTATLLELLDHMNRPSICIWLTNRWLTVRFQIGGAIFTLFAAAYIIADKTVTASLAGFILTYALVLEERIFWMIRHWANSQLYMSAVERLKREAVELAPEPQLQNEPPAYWPSDAGEIEVNKLAVRYAEGYPLALKGISFSVKSSERVAIVGRTGSGKSTLALSFFRFVEARSGQIIIDGTDISTINLHTLRDRLTIIPQEAALFSGTVRFNLDPFDQHADAELYDILRRTRLLTPGCSEADQDVPGRTETPDGEQDASVGHSAIRSLDDNVLQGGKNLSAGQKQLLCLARGLLKLRKSNVLILDESTANLDHATDVTIQSAIREEIGKRKVTVLCIAHRLQTVIDFDRVLVMSNGEIVEFDKPSKLLADGEERSEFARLCKETGDFEALKRLANAGPQDLGRTTE